MAKLTDQMVDLGEQTCCGELSPQLAAEMELDYSGTASAYCDNLLDSFSDFAAYDNPDQALPVSIFKSQRSEDDVFWNYAVPDLALDKHSPADQSCETAQRCVDQVQLNICGHTPTCHIPWQAAEPPGRHANINVIPGDTKIPKDAPAAVLPNSQPIISHPRNKPKTKPGKDHAGQSPLACPFQRLDAHKYHHCSKYLLRRIKDVKQHIYRRHNQPKYYCALCFDVFQTASERDVHTRRADCDKRPVPWFHGISDEQRRRLGRKASSTLGVEEQWFEIWDLIFPGHNRPKSVRVGSPSEEGVSVLRITWKNRGAGILKNVLDGSEAAGLQPLLLDMAVNAVFDSLEAESAPSPDDNDILWSTRSVDSQGQAPTSSNAASPF